MEFTLPEVDFRFADEEDVDDISVLINRSYAHEEEGPCSFRVSKGRVTAEEVSSDFLKPSVRWILLETPRPEELMVATLRLRIERSPDPHSVIELFGSADSLSLRNMLLSRAESVSLSLGCEKIVFEVPSWTESVQEWLQSCGYRDMGGRVWSESKNTELTRPTMVLCFQKALTSNESDSNASDSMLLPVPAREERIENVLEGLSIVDDNVEGNSVSEEVSNDPMRGLISDLFKALHAEDAALRAEQSSLSDK